MDVEIQRNVPSDDLEAAIEKAQADLADACRALPLKTDPIRLVMASHSAVLDVFGRSIRRFEKAVSDIIAARSPLSVNDKAAINEAMETGAYKAVKQEIRRVTRSLDFNQSKRIGLYVAGAFVLGAAPGLIAYHFAWNAGYAAGEERAVHLEAAIGHTLTKPDADQWLMLIENNEIAAAPRGCGLQGGRMACTFVFWNAPAPPPGAPAQAAAVTTITKEKR